MSHAFFKTSLDYEGVYVLEQWTIVVWVSHCPRDRECGPFKGMLALVTLNLQVLVPEEGTTRIKGLYSTVFNRYLGFPCHRFH